MHKRDMDGFRSVDRPTHDIREDNAYSHPRFICVVSVVLIAKWHFLTW